MIGVAAHDVQISGSMTGSHVGAYPLALLTDEGSPKSFLGDLISGAVLMCRTHECRGCMDAQERPWLLIEG